MERGEGDEVGLGKLWVSQSPKKRAEEASHGVWKRGIG